MQSLCGWAIGMGPEPRPPDSPALGLPHKAAPTLPQPEGGGRRRTPDSTLGSDAAWRISKTIPVAWGKQSSLQRGSQGRVHSSGSA